jgi:cytochrome c2
MRYLPLLAKRVVRELPTDQPPASRRRDDPQQRAVASQIAYKYDGKKLFQGAGCSLCHTIDIRGGEVGPPLTYIGRKRNAQNLERLLKDPEDILPGGKMPQLYLNDLQIKELALYLSMRQ